MSDEKKKKVKAKVKVKEKKAFKEPEEVAESPKQCNIELHELNRMHREGEAARKGN